MEWSDGVKVQLSPVESGKEEEEKKLHVLRMQNCHEKSKRKERKTTTAKLFSYTLSPSRIRRKEKKKVLITRIKFSPYQQTSIINIPPLKALKKISNYSYLTFKIEKISLSQRNFLI